MPAVQDLKTPGPQDLKITLPVEGMTCAACQANVQRALTATPGVTKAAVNLMTHQATVHYDPAATTPQSLVAAINDTGYASHLPVAGGTAQAEDEAREQAQAREYSTLLTKSVVSVIAGPKPTVSPIKRASRGTRAAPPSSRRRARAPSPRG